MNKLGCKFALFVFLFLSFNSYAQKGGITIEQTKSYINNKLNGKCIIDVKNTRLILSYYNNDDIYRKDQAYCGELDLATLRYVPEENYIYIKCGEDIKDCVLREIYKDKITRNYTRTGVDVTGLDERSIAGLQKAFTHLIKLMTNVKYENNEPFE